MNKPNDQDAVRCRATTSKGKPCLSFAQSDSAYCFIHDPARADERLAAQQLGGKLSRITEPPSPFPETGAETAVGLANLLSALIRDTWNHKASTKRARTIASLVRLQEDILRAARQEVIEAEYQASRNR